MCLLIDYQKEAGAIDGGPAHFEDPSEKNFPSSLGMLARSSGAREGRSAGEPSPEAPPTPPYRGMAGHTVSDFGSGDFENVAFFGAIGRGLGIGPNQSAMEGVRG
ncbi:hypothetical protein SAMN04515647_3815 [Cohaesibacter sp. ES.047]|nr:hypothetical protein SAMN04515647_3815 [Cohaesibacter sp. ES.047]